jgi:hypothetical protein
MKIATRPPGLAFAVLALWAAAQAPARADLTWNFSYDLASKGSGGDVIVSGTFTTSDVLQHDPILGADYYQILQISGSRQDDRGTYAIAGLVAPDGFFSNDNQLFPDAPHFSYSGVSFTLNDPDGTYVNLFYNQGDLAYNESTYDPVTFASVGSYGGPTVRLALQGVPEPSSIALAGVSGLMIAGVARRRRRSRSAA